MKKILPIFALLCVDSLIAEETNKPVRLPEVMVTAERVEEPINDVPYVVNVLSADDIKDKQLPRDFPEAFAETPGVMVQKTANGQSSPYVRGFTGFRTVLMVDGIRLNNSTWREGPNQYWGTVDAFSIKRIEMLKGPSSVLYGSDAIGGSVNAFTVAPHGYENKFTPNGEAFYRFGSAEDSQIGRTAAGGTFNENLGILIGGTIKYFGDVVAGGSTGEQEKTNYNEWDVDAKVEYRLQPNSRLIAAYQFVNQNDIWRTHRTIYGESWHGTALGTDLKDTFDHTRQLAYLQWHVDELTGPIESWVTSLSWQCPTETETRIRSSGAKTDQFVTVNTIGFWTQLTSPSPAGQWTYGVDYYHDFVNSGRTDYNANGTIAAQAIQGPVADDAGYDLLGAFVQDAIPFGEKIELTLGARYTYACADADKVLDPTTGTQTSLLDDWQNVSGSARIMWHVDEPKHWNIFAGASQGFRAPNFSDLTRLDIARSGELEIPTFNLHPEKFLALETGVKMQYEHISAYVSYYYTFINGMIVRTPTGNTVNGLLEVSKKNAGNGYLQGIEASGSWTFWPQASLSLFGWISWMEGMVDGYPNSSTVKEEEPISRLMPLTGEVGLRWQHPNKKFWAEFLVMMADMQDQLSSGDERDTQRIPPGGTPGYTILTVRGGWVVNKHLDLAVAVENLTNKDYRIHGSGVNEPGLNVVCAANLKF
jgi:hemoglobin/transferrin/lactoferrin receptor protein